MKSQLMLGAGVGLVLVLIVLMSLHDWTINTDVPPAVLEQAPVITSEGVSARVFDVDGKLKYTLKAETAVDFDFTQQLQLTRPQMEIIQKDGRWNVSALVGSMNGRGQKTQQEIVLKDQVEAQLQGRQSAHISAEELHYFPATEEVESPGKIVIHQQQNVTRAGHMQANLKTGKLRLSQGVESQYVVPAS